MSNDNSRLNSLIASIEQIEAERQTLNEDKKEYMAEAKALGYDTKLINRIIQRRKKERAEVLQADADLRAYEEELGMEMDMSLLD